MTAQKARVLVVEDDDLVLRTLTAMLEKMDAEVLCAHDGAEAIDMCERSRPDLVLLDLMMPRMNGFQFLRAFRQQDQWDTPVIIVSAKNDPVDHYWAGKLGAVSYLQKPFPLQRLTQVIEEALATRTKAQAEPVDPHR